METVNARQISEGLSSPFQANLSQIRVPLVREHQMLRAEGAGRGGMRVLFFSGCCSKGQGGNVLED